MKISKCTLLVVVVIGVIALSVACEKLSSPSSSDFNGSFEETPKTLKGEWQIIEASRNGTEITEQMDFSQFRITFNDDSTYQIQNRLPFIVGGLEGTWSFDDPQYPFKLTLDSNLSDRPPVTSDLSYPIVEGKRNLVLSFSAGCSTVRYQYVLERVTQE